MHVYPNVALKHAEQIEPGAYVEQLLVRKVELILIRVRPIAVLKRLEIYHVEIVLLVQPGKLEDVGFVEGRKDERHIDYEFPGANSRMSAQQGQICDGSFKQTFATHQVMSFRRQSIQTNDNTDERVDR